MVNGQRGMKKIQNKLSSFIQKKLPEVEYGVEIFAIHDNISFLVFE